MDDLDRRLLIVLQQPIPLQRRPFETMAKTAGTDEASLLLRIHRLKESGAIRSISAIFDKKSLGYKTLLVLMRIPEAMLEKAGTTVAAHPGVWQAYQRPCEFNLWFALGVPARETIEEHVRRLHRLAHADQTLILPVLKRYKPVEMDGFERDLSGAVAEALPIREKAVMQVLQEEFPLTDEPFKHLAARVELHESELLHVIYALQSAGYFKGIHASLHLGSGSAGTNTLVWQIPEEKMDQAGRILAGSRDILTCYQRPFYAAFPYSLFATMKSKSEKDIEVLAREMEDRLGKWPHRVLTQAHEIKKTRLRLFDDKLNEWWENTDEEAKGAEASWPEGLQQRTYFTG
jgi:DNA-binding Lrp family transcriptional regulator